MSIMVMSVIIMLVSGVAYLTVNWSGTPRRVVIAVIGFSILGTLTAGVTTVLAAARGTYADPRSRRDAGNVEP